MIKRYRTAWPHVTIKIMDQASGKPTVAAFGMDVIVPPSADPEDVKRLLAKGALVAGEPEAKVEHKAEPKAEPKPEPEPEPAKKPAAKSKSDS